MEERESNGVFGMIASIGAMMAKPFIAIGKGITQDGTLAAAWRQGADEIGEALKPFPESVQTQEVGTILNPTQGEVAQARGEDRSPSTPMNDNHIYDPRQENRQERGLSRGR